MKENESIGACNGTYKSNPHGKFENQSAPSNGNGTEPPGSNLNSATVAIPPDGGWGWVIVAASFACNLIVDGIVYTFSSFIPAIENEFKASKAEVSLIVSLLSGSYLLTGPFASALANRYGFRLVTILGSFLTTVMFVISNNADSVTFLCITYGVMAGIGFGMIFVPSVIVTGFYFEKWRALATGISVCGAGIGILTMPYLNEYVLQHYTWREAFLMQAGLTLLCSFLGFTFLPIKETIVQVPAKANLMLRTIGNEYRMDSPEEDKKLFTNNNKYPAASEILLGDRDGSNHNNNNHISAVSNIELSTLKTKRGSKELEMKILLPDDRSLREHKSQSFTERRDSPPLHECRNRSHTLSRIEFENRPLYREDIFFNANLRRLSQYNSHASSLNYTMSVTRLPTMNDVMEGIGEKTGKWSIFPEAVRRTLATMLDASLLKSPTFLLLAASGFFTGCGMYCPFIFTSDRATSMNHFSQTTAIAFISTIGLGNTLGRVAFGILGSIPRMDAIKISNAALTICGLSTAFSNLYPYVSYHYAYSGIFGLSISAFSALRTVVIVELLGLENLTNAFGLLMLFQGIAAIIGPPMMGYLYDVSGNYNLSFYLSGALITLSAVMCYPIKSVNKWERKRGNNAAV